MTRWGKIVNDWLAENPCEKIIQVNYEEIGHSSAELGVLPLINPFKIWTTNYVLIPNSDDFDDWVETVPRNPCEIKLK